MTRTFQPVVVLPIPTSEAVPWIMNRHYARRMCPVSYAFGAYDSTGIRGIVTFGTPVSSSLRIGICGEEWSESVLELNRLCCDNEKNMASRLVGGALKQIPKPSVIVSYADTEQGHVGYIYQATNFIYTGLSAKRTDWKIKGREHLHGATVADESRGHENRAAWMREKYGADFYLDDRPRKHRYVYFCGNKRQRAEMEKALKYEKQDYPKGESRHYDASAKVSRQLVLL